MNTNIEHTLLTLGVFLAPIILTCTGEKVENWWEYVIMYIILNLILFLITKIRR